jgi:hypothetical protein
LLFCQAHTSPISASTTASSLCVTFHALFDFHDFKRMAKSQTYVCAFRSLMGQRAVPRFLARKGLNPQQIHSELESMYEEDAPALPTIYTWHRCFPDETAELSDDRRSGMPRIRDLGEAFVSMCEERPFFSDKLLARHFRIAKATRLRILREDLALQKFNLRWVSHTVESA